MISKSLSHSNIPKPETSSMTPRRCSSVPPIIRMGYYKQLSPFDICGGVLSTDKVFSLSLSALTCDPIKNATTKKRSCSVSPTCRYENSDKNYQMLEALGNSNQLNSDVSYDGDYSGSDSDKTYYPSDSDNGPCHIDGSLLEDEPSTSSGVYYGNPNEGRKRQRNSDPNNWKKNKNKKLRMQGEEYLGYSKPRNMKLKQNIVRPARRLRTRCIFEFCKKSVVRNCNKFSDERRLEIHQSFWGNMNWDSRKIYVVGLVTRKGTARKTKDESRREGTYNYFLPLNETNKVQVCRTTFLNTLSL